MAEIIWTDPALADIDSIADYIALDDPEAARDVVRRAFRHVEQLIDHPESGSRPRELSGQRYRQILEPPCRIIYRFDGRRVFVVHVMRSEQLLKPKRLARERSPTKRR